jgi:hypothetical protein
MTERPLPENPDWCVKATITRWVDDDPQPGIVETRLTDRFGNNYLFVTKFYDVSDSDLNANSEYPEPGFIGCKVLMRHTDKNGRETALIDTGAHRNCSESTDGLTRFEVYADDVLPSPDWQQISLVPLHPPRS